MRIGMRVFMYLRGTEIGRDAEGNRYFIERWSRGRGVRRRRWVLYPRDAEASSVPAEWHAWLHHTTDAPLTEMPRYPWQRPHLRNATGTASAYRPPGHDSMGGQRAAADGDYESWAPAPPQMSAVPRIGQALETEQQP